MENNLTPKEIEALDRLTEREEIISAQADKEFREQKFNALRKAAEPLIKYLCDNHNPHVTAIVTSTSVEIMTGEMSIPNIMDFVKD